MKRFAVLTLLALELAVCGCGNSNTNSTTTTTSASGNWEAQLSGGTGQASLLKFIAGFDVTNSGPLTVKGFSFFNKGACFATVSSESGSATLTTDASNNVTGTLTFTVQSGTPAGNTLTLNGTALTGTSSSGKLTGGAVSGTWTLTGGAGDPGCGNQTGNFTLCQSPNTSCSTI